MQDRLEEINREINRIQLEIAEVQSGIDYTDPGSYYEGVREIHRLEMQAADLNEEWYEVQNNPNS